MARLCAEHGVPFDAWREEDVQRYAGRMLADGAARVPDRAAAPAAPSGAAQLVLPL